MGLYIFYAISGVISYYTLRAIFMWHLQISSSVKLLLDSMQTNPDSWTRHGDFDFNNKKLGIRVFREDRYDSSRLRVKVHEPAKNKYDFMRGTIIPLNKKEYRAVSKSLKALDTRWDRLEEERKRELLFNTVSEKLIED